MKQTNSSGHPDLPNLTAIRGIAALLVVVFHFEILLVLFVQPQQSMFFRKCYLMVDLFFILSGFIIYHVYGRAFSQRISREALRKYGVARIARIYPLHVAALLIILLTVVLSAQPMTGIYDLKALPAVILLLHSFGVNHSISWNVPSWSISAEFFAYGIFPFAAWLIGKSRLFSWVLTLVVCVLYYVLAFYLNHPKPNALHNIDITYDFGFLRGLAGFLTGVLIYQLYDKRVGQRLLRTDVFLILLMGCAGYALHSNATDLLLVVCFGFVVLAVAYNDGLASTIFRTRPFQFLGNISYSLYLMQSVLYRVVVLGMQYAGIKYKGPFSLHLPAWPAFLCCMAYLAALIVLSAASYRYFERPARAAIKKAFV